MISIPNCGTRDGNSGQDWAEQRALRIFASERSGARRPTGSRRELKDEGCLYAFSGAARRALAPRGETGSGTSRPHGQTAGEAHGPTDERRRANEESRRALLALPTRWSPWMPWTERYRSGQTGQTVNLLAQPSEVRILPSPPPLPLARVIGPTRERDGRTDVRRSEQGRSEQGQGGNSSVGRARAFQARGRGFEPRFPLQPTPEPEVDDGDRSSRSSVGRARPW